MNTQRDDLEYGFGFELAELAQAWRKAIDDRLRPEGLTQATWKTLFYLSEGHDGAIQRELATALGIEDPSLVRLLDALEVDGLIERRNAASDRRSKTVHLTAKGKCRYLGIQEVAAEVRGELLRDVSDSQLAHSRRVFERIRKNAGEQKAVTRGSRRRATTIVPRAGDRRAVKA